MKRVALIILAFIVAGVAGFYLFARMAFGDGCDVDMSTPDAFLAAHDVVGRGIVISRETVSDLGAFGMYVTDTADLSVVRYRVRQVEMMKGESQPVFDLWVLETRYRPESLDPRKAWPDADTLVFYGEHLNGRSDNLRLMAWWTEEQVEEFERGRYSRSWEHWGPQDSIISSRLRDSVPVQRINASGDSRSTLIVRSTEDMFSLNYFKGFCLSLGGGFLRSERITTVEFVTRLRSMNKRARVGRPAQ